MSVIYQWKINQLERTSDADVVMTAHWECTGVEPETENTGRSYGSVGFATPDPTDPGFIPFEELTEELVLGWVWDSQDNKESVEQNILTEIETKNNPPVLTGVPW